MKNRVRKPVTLAHFLARETVGLIARVHARKPEQVPDRVAMMRKLYDHACAAVVQGKMIIRRIDVMVLLNNEYEDHDCGMTIQALKEEFAAGTHHLPIPIIFHPVYDGDLYCTLLNDAVGIQMNSGIKYSLIISPEAASYLTPETMEDMVQAAADGALCVGVAINELSESILKGEIANTFALWRNDALVSVGSFNLLAWNPTDPQIATCIEGWDSLTGKVVRYERKGVEEVIPLALLARKYGDEEFIAPILPRGEGIQHYQVPDPISDKELYQRHLAKMGTKEQRKRALLAPFGFDLSRIRGAVMKKYRIQN